MESAGPKVRLAEAIACLSLATDLASGQPLEHGLRRALIAVWLAESLKLSAEELSTVYYVALLGGLGCVLNTAAIAGLVRDEIEFRGDMFAVDFTRRLPAIAFMARRVGAGESPSRRLGKLLALSQTESIFRDVALHVGDVLDIGSEIRQALGQCEEHWNGKSAVLGLKGDEIALPARLFLLAQDIDVFNRLGGPDAAVEVARQRAGTYYDPQLVTLFCREAPRLLARVQAEASWDALMVAEPEPARLLSASELDDVLRQIADFIDMRSTYTLGHSSKVADLAEKASRIMGLSEPETESVRRAGLLHDLGRSGISVATWQKSGALTLLEVENMRRHPALTELLLAHSSSLGLLGTMAGLHHERIDGTGYRGVTSASLPLTARLLATADAYQTKIESRPHRHALTEEGAANVLRQDASQGRLDEHVVQAVLAATDQPSSSTAPATPASLSQREVEVLRLLVRGQSNRQIADVLVISPKTVGHHIESIYSKMEVSSRVGATLFALKHRLL